MSSTFHCKVKPIETSACKPVSFAFVVAGLQTAIRCSGGLLRPARRGAERGVAAFSPAPPPHLIGDRRRSCWLRETLVRPSDPGP